MTCPLGDIQTVAMPSDDTQGALVTLSGRIGDEIRVLLVKARRRQADLARAAGVTEHWLSMRLLGRTIMSIDDLAQVTRHLSSKDRESIIKYVAGELSATADQTCIEKLPEKDSNLQPFGSQTVTRRLPTGSDRVTRISRAAAGQRLIVQLRTGV